MATRPEGITDDDVDDLRHMLGIGTARPGYRNHYVAGPGHQGMARLEAAGLVVRLATPRWMNSEDQCFSATEAGKRLAKEER